MLAHDRTDDFGKEYKKDAVVIAGHFVEPDSGEFGPGPHHVWVEKTCLMFADELITHCITSEPKIVLLATIDTPLHLLVDGGPDGVHESILKTLEGHV